jgi:hypothetical protein
MEPLYRKGYLVRILSWENDGDNYNTQEYNTDTEQDARAVVEFCALFSRANPNTIGNIYDPHWESEERTHAHSVILEFHKSHPGFMDVDTTSAENDAYSEDDYIVEAYLDFAYDLGLRGGEFFTRVCESVEVFRIPEDVLVEKMEWW